MKRVVPFLFVFLSLAVWGCTGGGKLRVQEQRQLVAGEIGPGDAITVVGLSGTSEDALECIDDSLRNLMPGSKVIPPAEFRDIMFPWFEPNMAPRATDTLSRLLRRTAVKRHVDALGVRYVVTIGGGTVGKSSGWGGAFVGPGAGGFIGGVSTQQSTKLTAGILDLKKARLVSEIEAGAEGGGGVGLIVLIPYFVSPGTETITCKAIAERVVAFIEGKTENPTGPTDSSN